MFSGKINVHPVSTCPLSKTTEQIITGLLHRNTCVWKRKLDKDTETGTVNCFGSV